MVKDGSFAPTIKETQTCKNSYIRWSDAELALVRQHPELTSKELSEFLPQRTAKAIRHIRERLGRYAEHTPLCQVCGTRVVWTDSAKARRMGLCKGCFLDEMELREREAARANALRQQRLKNRRRRAKC